jgi:hypothetical protein
MYRIKIEERNNGQKLYIPQVGKLLKVGNWIKKKEEIVWYNILKAYETTLALSTTIAAKYGNEEDALKVIGDYKNKHQVGEDNKVKSTSYKMID